jgi:hypothetical protein
MRRLGVSLVIALCLTVLATLTAFADGIPSGW